VTSPGVGSGAVAPTASAPREQPPSVTRSARDGRRTLGWTIALAVVVAGSAICAVLLHRNGHNQGDDFALYLRQARSLFDGDVAQVVADNRFAVLNSGAAFSPIAYPWGFPLLLSPFVKWWGLDYDRLKLVEVACFCAWVVLAHGVIRRRAGRVLALAIAAVVATAPALLAHTDQLLSEYPHAAAVGVFIWWFDRIKLERPLIGATTRQLVVLGVLGAVAYNVRRESVVLIGAILIVQVVEQLSAWRGSRRMPVPWLTVATPHLAFVGSIIGFQLLLPSMLIPDSGDGPQYIGDRVGDWTGVLTQHLGLGDHPVLGALILVLAVVGMAVGCVRRPRLDIPLTVITLLSVATVSTHFRMVGRYYFQVLPWVLYFAAAAIVAGVELVRRPQARRAATAIAAVPLLYLVAVHVAVLPGDIADAREFDRDGRQQIGPADPGTVPIFDAVAAHTPPDAVVAYFRARTMTLLTDRRSFQTTNLQRVLQRADYFAQQRYSSYFQPDVSVQEAQAAGLEEVWSNDRWVLWRVPELKPET
jgi:hypothetical protein